METCCWYHTINQFMEYPFHSWHYICHATRDRYVTQNLVVFAEVAKMAIFKVYLRPHLWIEVELNNGLWIYGTISKIHRAGFLNFAFVFELSDFKVHGGERFWLFCTNFKRSFLSHEQSWRHAVGTIRSTNSWSISFIPDITYVTQHVTATWPRTWSFLL